jgi:hypothetical protein
MLTATTRLTAILALAVLATTPNLAPGKSHSTLENGVWQFFCPGPVHVEQFAPQVPNCIGVEASADEKPPQVTSFGQWVAVEEVYDTGEWETVYNLRISDYHTYFVGGEDWGFSVWAHNLCAADHHMVPRALGSRVSYGNSILTPLSAAEHTHLHRALNNFLQLRTRTLPTGQVVDMYARAGNSGSLVRSTFTQTERLNALDTFYRNYRGGMYYSNFGAERAYTLAVPGRFI